MILCGKDNAKRKMKALPEDGGERARQPNKRACMTDTEMISHLVKLREFEIKAIRAFVLAWCLKNSSQTL